MPKENKDNKDKKIKIENIFYLLSYAWDCAGKNDEPLSMGADNFDNAENVYSKLIDLALTDLYRSGSSLKYKNYLSDLKGIKGKLNLSETIKRCTLPNGITYCEYDEFTMDHLINQIIKSTLRLLLKSNNLHLENTKHIETHLLHFENVSDIKLMLGHFSQISFNRLNKKYKFIIELSKLIFQSMSPGKAGSLIIENFLYSNVEMSALFEKFLRNFFDKELKTAKVSGERLRWEVGAASDQMFIDRTPSLLTDISIVGQNNVLVIDAKFYQEALVSRGQNSFKYRREHLSQLMDYMRITSRRYQKAIRGILVYPTAGIAIDDFGTIEGFPIRVFTLDLSQDWSNVKSNLLNLYTNTIESGLGQAA